ncbi:MAG: PD-(D/E)XK nuclease family protein [Vicinamibacterales bacterium]
MITPRTITLLRLPDLQTLHATVARLAADDGPLAARRCAVLVPTRGAAEALRRTIENLTLVTPAAAMVLPDIVTRDDFYTRLHRELLDAPPLLSGFEREVLVRRAARLASTAGVPAPFRLRAGLIVEILALYDELRRHGRTVGQFERLMIDSLEPGADSDRGAERLLRQTRFLVAVFQELERRVCATGRLDEHGLRERLLGGSHAGPYSRVIVTLGDQSADPRGLWSADYALLSRMTGLERIELLATEPVLATGLHQRLHDIFPGLDEQRLDSSAEAPVLVAPAPPLDGPGRLWFVSRDREEELADLVRAAAPGALTDRTAVVFQRPLPYLYLARTVFDDARVAYQALDARPLAAEPFAAALDLAFEVGMSEATRAPLIDLLGSPHWRFVVDDTAVDAAEVAALDAYLREIKYLGGWERLQTLAAAAVPDAPGRAGRVRARAHRALSAAAAAARELRSATEATTASAQIAALVTFIVMHEQRPELEDPTCADHTRARAAMLGALSALGEAHAAHDNEALLVTELANTVRRWIEGQTFSPRTGTAGVTLLDARAAAYADVDQVRLVGLADSDWPERARRNIFYPMSLLGQLGWPKEIDRLTAARARFYDLLRLARREVSVSTFTLEDDAVVSPSTFLEEIRSSGLNVVRVPLPDVGEVAFVQEALRGMPVLADPDRGVASLPLGASEQAWLDLRMTRAPATDPGFHGAAGARAPIQYAVSHVERYLDCPFKYFSSHVLGLDEERDDDAGLSPRERGQFLHEVFQQFFVAWETAGHRSITSATLPDALALFERVVETRLEQLSDADRALERNYLLGSAAASGLAERAFAFEIEQGAGVVERLLEHPLEGVFTLKGPDDAPVRIRIRGKADRIDLLDDGTLRVVDYKLGRAPKAARALQLPVYGVCASQQLEGRHGRSWPLSRAGYLAFKEKNAFVSLGGNSGQIGPAVDDGQTRMVEAVAAIERGDFPVDPDEPYFCTRCGYAGVCRKDYVGDE